MSGTTTLEIGIARTAMRIGNSNDDGLMLLRFTCINDLRVKESDRKYFWPLAAVPMNDELRKAE